MHRKNRFSDTRNLVLSYFVKGENSTVFDSGTVMAPMTMIDILKQPRFVPLPDHSHNYLELIYMCSGSTTHIINTRSELTLKEDELLFLPQGTSHSVSAAGYHDISVSFAILPAFLQYPLSMLREDTLLRRFILQVSENDKTECEFLHFHLQDMPEAKNLLENMTRILLKRQQKQPADPAGHYEGAASGPVRPDLQDHGRIPLFL